MINGVPWDLRSCCFPLGTDKSKQESHDCSLTPELHCHFIIKLSELWIGGSVFWYDSPVYPSSTGILIEVLTRVSTGVKTVQYLARWKTTEYSKHHYAYDIWCIVLCSLLVILGIILKKKIWTPNPRISKMVALAPSIVLWHPSRVSVKMIITWGILALSYVLTLSFNAILRRSMRSSIKRCIHVLCWIWHWTEWILPNAQKEASHVWQSRTYQENINLYHFTSMSVLNSHHCSVITSK